MTGKRGYYTLTEITVSRVTTIRRLMADSLEEAEKRFDDGEWESQSEQVGDCMSVVYRDIESPK